MVIESMPPPVIVVARVVLSGKSPTTPPQFTTTLYYSTGTSIAKDWEAAGVSNNGHYAAIFGVPHDITRGETVLKQ
jgi:hypothetical protein